MIGSALSDSSYLDFHTHEMRHAARADVVEIISKHLGEEKACNYFTVGMHPWWTQSLSNDEEKVLRLALGAKHCLAMGEMGLDKLKGPKMDIQKQILRQQLRLADELGKPVIIHCVRAYGHLTGIPRLFPNIPSWCIHGYARHATLAWQLIDQGFYLSLMPTSATKYQALFESLPHERLFLETDSMAQADIVDIYQLVSSVTAIDQVTLKRRLNQNAVDFFGYE